MTVEGKMIEKFEVQAITETFKKREFVLEYAENPQYPEFIKFELIQSNCEQLDNMNVGDEVTVNFNLKGRKWTDPKGEVKYFNSLQAWRVEKRSSPAGAPLPPPPTESPEWLPDDSSKDDDLPF